MQWSLVCLPWLRYAGCRADGPGWRSSIRVLPQGHSWELLGRVFQVLKDDHLGEEGDTSYHSLSSGAGLG